MTAPDQKPVHATQEELAEDWRLQPVRATQELARKLGLRRGRGVSRPHRLVQFDC